jgi:hypothetical protein
MNQIRKITMLYSNGWLAWKTGMNKEGIQG